MVTAKLSDMVTRLGGRLAADSPGPAATDADLLARFLAGRDEAAFALLVRRHGPLVFGVCRRVIGNHHLAEDAFQAVFVVLARKAGTVRPRTALPAWLYGVAYRTALRARTVADRRRRREAPAETSPEPAATPTDPVEAADLAAVLDAEIAQLPDRLRVPVVLCELEGRSRQEAAGELGIPEGTLSSRLAAARKALAARLRGRGIALSAAGLTGALSQVAAGVPPALAARAVAAALSPGVLPAPVAALSSGVIRIMFAQKLKIVSATLGIVAAAVLVGGGLLGADPPKPADPTAGPSDPPKSTARPAPPRAEPRPLPKGPNKLLFFRDGRLVRIDPDGKNARPVTADPGAFAPSGPVVLSPDGKGYATLIRTPEDRAGSAGKLYVRSFDEKGPGTDLGVECSVFRWSPDGRQLIGLCMTTAEAPDGRKRPAFEHVLVDVKTREKTVVKLPPDHVVTDWSRDGRYFLTVQVRRDSSGVMWFTGRMYLVNRDGTEHKMVADGRRRVGMGTSSPDGSRVLCLAHEGTLRKLAVADVATGAVTPVEGVPADANLDGYCWSPDGTRIAYLWTPALKLKPGEGPRTEQLVQRLVVCDPDGKNAKTIASGEFTTLAVAPSDLLLADPDGTITATVDVEKAADLFLVLNAHLDWR